MGNQHVRQAGVKRRLDLLVLSHEAPQSKMRGVRTPAVILLLLFAAACSSEDSPIDPDAGMSPSDAASVSPDAYAEPNTRWPTSTEELPNCAPELPFVPPTVAVPTGKVQLSVSSFMQPTGVDERVLVTVLEANSDDVDADLAAVFESVTVSGDAQIVESQAVSQGQSEILVRFAQPGLHTITASLSDGRTGNVEVMAYETRLPVLELTMPQDDFNLLVDQPFTRHQLDASLGEDGVDHPTLVRVHGGSSREYPKKSFRFDLGPGETLENGRDHIILRAEWNDKSMLRNYLALELFRQGTWLPTPKAAMVHFRVNGRYYGVMWQVDRVDADLLAEFGLSRDGVLLKPELEGDYRSFDMMEPLDSPLDYEAVFGIRKGEQHGVFPADIQSLVEDVLTIEDNEAFVQSAEEVVDTESVLVWMAANSVVQNADHIKKNHYIYRDPDGDVRWRYLPWDFELTLGHHWSEENETLEEFIYVGTGIYEGKCPGYCNRMMSRLWDVPAYEEMYFSQIQYLLDHTFRSDFFAERIDNALCLGTMDILADPNKRANNEEYISRVDEIRDFVVDQREALADELSN